MCSDCHWSLCMWSSFSFRMSQNSSKVSLFPGSVPLETEKDETAVRQPQSGLGWGSWDQPSPFWSSCDHGSWGTNLRLLRLVILLLAEFLETGWQQTYYTSSGVSWFQPVGPCLFRIKPYVKIQGVGTGVLRTENCTSGTSVEIRDPILDSHPLCGGVGTM